MMPSRLISDSDREQNVRTCIGLSRAAAAIHAEVLEYGSLLAAFDRSFCAGAADAFDGERRTA